MPLGKILRSRFGRKASGRKFDTLADVAVGDLVSFKHRLALPPDVQGTTYEISGVATYEYEDGIYPQLSLDGETEFRLFLTFKVSSPRDFCLSRVVPRRDVTRLFDENEFGALWDEGFTDLAVKESLPEYSGWLGDRYAQLKRSAEGYYHDRDCRSLEIGADEGEEFRAHECEDSSGRFGLSVEVFGDGETEVSVEVHCDSDVIDSMWPGSSS